MRKIYYYIVLVTQLFLYISCSDGNDTYSEQKSISLKLYQQRGFTTKAIDEDNLAVEQTVKNISVFFTEPSSNTITYKYVNSGFTSVDDYKLIDIPLEPSVVKSKDIYIVANYKNTTSLDAVSTVEDLKALTTPAVDKTNNLEPQNGFCMYGATFDFDFDNGTNTAAIVNMERTCAKIRLNVTFPEDPALSTNNSFLIQKAAKYTYVVEKDTVSIPTTDYFTFATPIALTDNGAGAFTNIAYVYEAGLAPRLYIYTHMGNSPTQQEFSTNLPRPVRNYLYDISIDIYEDSSTTKSFDPNGSNKNYSYKTSIKVYRADGSIVEE